MIVTQIKVVGVVDLVVEYNVELPIRKDEHSGVSRVMDVVVPYRDMVRGVGFTSHYPVSANVEMLDDQMTPGYGDVVLRTILSNDNLADAVCSADEDRPARRAAA